MLKKKSYRARKYTEMSIVSISVQLVWVYRVIGCEQAFIACLFFWIVQIKYRNIVLAVKWPCWMESTIVRTGGINTPLSRGTTAENDYMWANNTKKPIEQPTRYVTCLVHATNPSPRRRNATPEKKRDVNGKLRTFTIIGFWFHCI
jgi:hypothetical protein